ncbi:MAG: hypothetical protein AAGL90_17030 [Pseudomonadota bacterium]
MVDFGPNGTVMTAQTEAMTDGSYRVPADAKIKRIGLASFLCGVAACMLVSLIGVGLIFMSYQVSGVIGWNVDSIFADDGFFEGAGFATLMAAMNWYFAYFTVPAAWIAIGFSLGRLPHRGILHPLPYYRWGAIWGAILVGVTTAGFSFMMSTNSIMTAVGGGLTGMLIGAVAGVFCGALFRAIVRPAEQVRTIQVDVF